MLSKSDHKKLLAVHSLAHEAVKLHKRQCTENFCSGRSKMWWVIRHEDTPGSVVTQEIAALAAQKMQVCTVLEILLSKGEVPWLSDAEKTAYRLRTAQERAWLLGHGSPQEPEQEEPETSPQPFPVPSQTLRRPARRRYESVSPTAVGPAYSGLSEVLSALTRRG